MAISHLEYCYIIFFFILLWLISLLILRFASNKSQPSISLPPSPPSIPIFGHLHLLLSIPFHKRLQSLSASYGPLLHLRVFRFPVILISSASAAYEVYRTNDICFSERNIPPFEDSLVFGPYGIISAPYGDYWKFMKKFVMTEMLGPQHLEMSSGIRKEEIEMFFLRMLERSKKGESVDVRKEMTRVTNNSICRVAMSTSCSGGEDEAEKMEELVTESFTVSKKLFISVALSFLNKFGISLFRKDIMSVSRKYDELLEKIIREHEENPNRDCKDMMDLMLDAYRNENTEFKITRNHIKAFFVEILIGGTDTSAATTQWTMAELINHPKVFNKVRQEIESVIGTNSLVQESDLPNLPYLQAVLQEGLRLHPPGPILIRKCLQDCKLGGFDILKDWAIAVNVYAIMRDGDSWENPDEFYPERFLETSNSKVRDDDTKIQSLNFLAFGSGRRGCPAKNLAYMFMGTGIATMVQCFDWKLVRGDKVDMEEGGDMVMCMARPFECIPVVRCNPLANL